MVFILNLGYPNGLGSLYLQIKMERVTFTMLGLHLQQSKTLLGKINGILLRLLIVVCGGTHTLEISLVSISHDRLE